MLYWMNGEYISAYDVNKFQQINKIVCFETFRTYQGKVALFYEHYHSICAALNELRLGFSYSLSDIYKVVSELTKKAGGEDGVFYIMVFIKDCEWQLGCQRVNLLIARKAFQTRKRGTERKAQWLQTIKPSVQQQVDNLLKNPLNTYHVAESGIHNLVDMENFYLTPKGFIGDSLASNIFWVKDDILYTPSLTTGIVPGVVRNWLIVTANKLGYLVIEDFFIKSELEEAYECFITNSIDELIPIASVGKVRFLGEDGPVYQLFHQVYIEEIIQTVKRSTL